MTVYSGVIGSASALTGTISGATGAPGINAYVHIKYALAEPKSNEDMMDTPSDWIGFYSGKEMTAPGQYTAYQWYMIKGDTGQTAYDMAVLGGYADTLERFYADLAKVDAIASATFAANNAAYLAGEKAGEADNAAQAANAAAGAASMATTEANNARDGALASTRFLHIKYSGYATPVDAQVTDDPDNPYMGICTDFIETAPTTASSYAWSRIQGIQGLRGEIGPQGPQGETGPQGIQGEIGPQGVKGEVGVSAYETAVLGGYSGSQADFIADLASIEGLASELAGV